MSETDLIENPPADAVAPLTVLRSNDERMPELIVLDAAGTIWRAFPPVIGWRHRPTDDGPYQRAWFHEDDWTEIEVAS